MFKIPQQLLETPTQQLLLCAYLVCFFLYCLSYDVPKKQSAPQIHPQDEFNQQAEKVAQWQTLVFFCHRGLKDHLYKLEQGHSLFY